MKSTITKNQSRSFLGLVLAISVSLFGCGGEDKNSTQQGASGVGLPVVALQNIEIEGFSLDQAFDPQQTTYTAQVNFLTQSFQVVVTAERPTVDIIEIAGQMLTSGSLSTPHTIAADSSLDLVITVRRQEPGSAEVIVQNYTITVTRPDANAFAQQAMIKADSSVDVDDQFGYQIALAGDTMAVGIPGDDSGARIINGAKDTVIPFADSGAVYILTRNDGIWTEQAYLKASNADPSDGFGKTLALAGDTLVVGASLEDSSATTIDGDKTNNSSTLNAGAAYVFVRDDNGQWTEQAYLKASNTSGDDRFGSAVAISGDSIAVGAVRQSTGASWSGAVYVFTRDNGTWSEQAFLKASNAAGSDFFGEAMALSDNTLVVGAYLADGTAGNDQGAVYVFNRTGSNWSEQAILSASNADGFDNFGSSVSLSGDTLAVGAYHEDEGGSGKAEAGAVYVFKRAGSSWTEQAYLKASDHTAKDNFGEQVLLDGNVLAVTASIDSARTTSAQGKVYLFTRADGSWTEQTTITASNASNQDEFGLGLALSGDMLAIGAPHEDGMASNAGATYLFQ